MNLLVKRALSMGIPAVVGASAGAAGTVALTTGAHESIVVRLGDTLTFAFSTRSDSIFRPIGNQRAVAAKCGPSFVYLRGYSGGSKLQPLTADTIAATVPCPQAEVASVGVCLFPNRDSMAKYAVRGDTGIDDRLVPCDSAIGTLYLARGAHGRIIPPPQSVAGAVPIWMPGTGPFVVQSTR